MRYIETPTGLAVVELTRRNLLVLLAKLEDPTSIKMIDDDQRIAVRAVPDEEHYTTRAPGEVISRHLDKAYDPSWQDRVAAEAADEGPDE